MYHSVIEFCRVYFGRAVVAVSVRLGCIYAPIITSAAPALAAELFMFRSSESITSTDGLIIAHLLLVSVNASFLLSSARQNGDANYDPNSAITVYYATVCRLPYALANLADILY